MTSEPIVYLLWNDLVGMTRTRGVPKADLETKLETGLGWACAGFALTPFDTIVDNDWGPMDEVRQIPDPRSYFAYQSGVFDEAWEAVICDSKRGPTENWECCPRTFYRHALEDLRSDAGLTFVAGVEHEFSLEMSAAPEASFSFAAARRANGVLQACAAALRSARLVPETLEPEFGQSQYEISCAPQSGMAAADSAVIARELIRAVASDHSMRASFSPLTASGAAGNGAHVHFSLVDRNGENITHDPSQPLGLSKSAAQFCAGVLAHLDALVALTAPSPLSYGVSPRHAGLRLQDDRGAEPGGGAARGAVGLERSGPPPPRLQHRISPVGRLRLALSGARRAGAGGPRRHQARADLAGLDRWRSDGRRPGRDDVAVLPGGGARCVRGGRCGVVVVLAAPQGDLCRVEALRDRPGEGTRRGRPDRRLQTRL